MFDNFFGYRTFFGGRVRIAVIGVVSCGDEGAETFVAGMGGDVDAAAAENVVVGGEDGGWGVGGVGCVGVAHDDVMWIG